MHCILLIQTHAILPIERLMISFYANYMNRQKYMKTRTGSSLNSTPVKHMQRLSARSSTVGLYIIILNVDIRSISFGKSNIIFSHCQNLTFIKNKNLTKMHLFSIFCQFLSSDEPVLGHSIRNQAKVLRKIGLHKFSTEFVSRTRF